MIVSANDRCCQGRVCSATSAEDPKDIVIGNGKNREVVGERRGEKAYFMAAENQDGAASGWTCTGKEINRGVNSREERGNSD